MVVGVNGNTVLVLPKKHGMYVEEATMLVKTLGLNIVETIFIRKPNPNFYIPLHISNSIRKLVEEDGVELLILYDNVKPRQIINLMKELRIEVWDRTRLILEIFSSHAGSMEAKLQIELAKIKHEIPLIKEYIRQAKLKELPGFLGPGRYAIDAYYRMLRSREALIRRRLEKLKNRRINLIKNRREQGFIHVALTGYTSAGKTTLFNTLTGENKPTGPEAFTTLYTKAKKIKVKGVELLVSDTVGFIRDVPVEIIEAFHATLAEIAYSDIVIVVVDASENDIDMIDKLNLSLTTLRNIGVTGKPLVIVLNKIDLITNDDIERKMTTIKSMLKDYNNIKAVIPVSALRGTNIDLLRKELWHIASALNGKKYTY